MEANVDGRIDLMYLQNLVRREAEDVISHFGLRLNREGWLHFGSSFTPPPTPSVAVQTDDGMPYVTILVLAVCSTNRAHS